jgi:hypothetical protein
MSIFGKILEKLGLRKEKEEEKTATVGTRGSTNPTTGTTSQKPSTTASNPKPTTTAKPTGTAPTSERGVATGAGTADRRQRTDAAVKHDPAPAPTKSTAPAMSEADVMTMLEQKASGTGLNWKQSISDLLFLLDLDNSYDARVELAKELDAPQEVMGDSARMNTWLHKTVLKKIAENGGNIPQELLD